MAGAGTVAAYAETAQGMGGISLRPTAVELGEGAATVTDDVLFGGNAAYADQSGTIEQVEGTWVVSRSEFCDFMAAARTPCPAS